MKKSIVVSTVTLCVLLAGCTSDQASAQTVANSPPTVANSAKLYLIGKDNQNNPGGKKSCSLDIKESETHMGDTDCKNDEVYFYRLDNVPSATLITLDAEDKCRKDNDRGDWQYTLRTYNSPTTTEYKKISDLKDMEAGDIVSAGVIVERGYHNKGGMGGKLSCVKISP
ncbi:hypothetical protein [Pseudomonas alabamensis]|uniref:hypothetical protein n=1 Tax=Pseudomonas alabamensis TaxID=3064349 RepID=UPI00119ECFD1